jgi:hypothetical protein
MSVPLFVPTRVAGAADVAAIQFGRRPDGVRVGIAFSSMELLRAATGPRQEWIRMHESVLRELLSPFGISIIQLDPVLVGPDVGTPTPASAPASASEPAAASTAAPAPAPVETAARESVLAGHGGR